jgi:hypothetical protein
MPNLREEVEVVEEEETMRGLKQETIRSDK